MAISTSQTCLRGSAQQRTTSASDMQRGEEAHDRSLFLERFPLIDKVQELANGSQGKLALPGDGKAAKNTGDAAAGKVLLDTLRSVDVMHATPPGCTAVTYDVKPPTVEDLQLHVRDRASPGSRWWKWESPRPVTWLDAVSIRSAGKLQQLCEVSVLLSGRTPDNAVHHIAEEMLTRLPTVKGEMIVVADGVTSASGELVGSLRKYQCVCLELFECDRSSSWPELGDITIKAQVKEDDGL
jgi:hypothetical protein